MYEYSVFCVSVRLQCACPHEVPSLGCLFVGFFVRRTSSALSAVFFGMGGMEMRYVILAQHDFGCTTKYGLSNGKIILIMHASSRPKIVTNQSKIWLESSALCVCVCAWLTGIWHQLLCEQCASDIFRDAGLSTSYYTHTHSVTATHTQRQFDCIHFISFELSASTTEIPTNMSGTNQLVLGRHKLCRPHKSSS